MLAPTLTVTRVGLGAVVVAFLLFPSSAAAADLCVGSSPSCFVSIQDAVDAAEDGDTIRIGRGTFAGGVVIDKSVTLVGQGSAVTIVRGGGPVLTIGGPLGSSTQHVEIRRLTITGGINESMPSSFFAAGGGVWIPEGAGGAPGATVTIVDSVITRNRVSAALPLPLCGHLCSFASGGGIANAGALSVVDSLITGNVAGSAVGAGSATSDAIGGGVRNFEHGTLVVERTGVLGNRSAVTAPVGRFAESGGIANDGGLTIERSVVNGNEAAAVTAVPSSFPLDVQQEAVGGGIRLTEGSSATITSTTISRNRVTSFNEAGDAQATSGGIDADGSLTLVDSKVDRNEVFANVPPASGFLAGAVFGGLEVQGTLSARHSSISGNVLLAVSATGPANIGGGGIGSLSGAVSLKGVLIVGNAARAEGIGGLAVGGGLLSVDFGSGPPTLEVRDSVVVANRLTAGAGYEPLGGGIFSADLFSGTPFPFTLERTVIRGNEPDQCFGC
jgi:hypothetical protein